MPEYSPKSKETVRLENELQYGEVWPLSADIRREHTLKYAVPQRNMWKEMADVMVGSGVSNFVDFGASSGYIIRQALNSGFEGKIIGIEKEASYLSLAEQIIRADYPDADFALMEGDAQNLGLDDNSTEAAIAANLAYHLPQPGRLSSEVHRIVSPGGIIVFSTKDMDHQEEVWMLANLAGVRFGAEPIHPFYWHYPITQMRHGLEQSKKFRVINEISQFSESQIRDDNQGEGWDDLKQVVFSLVSLMKSKETGLPPSLTDVNEFLETREVREFLFKRQVENKGFFQGKVRMAFWVCENLK